VIDFRDLADPRIERRWGEGEGFRTALLVRCRYFRVEEVEIDRRWESACRGERFRIISVVRGSGALVHGGGRGEIVLSAGDNILLPAALGAYAVRAGAGGCTLLQTEVP
jgi:mannose-6-phosphate isomerase class I